MTDVIEPVPYIGDYETDSNVLVWFSTHDTSGEFAAPSSTFESTDFRVYKSKATSTGAYSGSAVSIESNRSSVNGLHLITIDLDFDSGAISFFEPGYMYAVVFDPDFGGVGETVDGVSPEKIIGAFSIARRCVLASYGLDQLSITGPDGVATTFREMLVQIWRRFFGKVDRTSSQIRTYRETGQRATTQGYTASSQQEVLEDAEDA